MDIRSAITDLTQQEQPDLYDATLWNQSLKFTGWQEVKGQATDPH